jgi:steroid 5-alpha reductase family enzyme
MPMDLWLYALVFSVLLNLAMFVPAYLLQTDKLTDISYAVSFFVLAAFGLFLSEKQALHFIVFFMVALWSVRLGGFLLMRIMRIGKDARFDGMRDKPAKFIKFWVLQGITVPIVMASVLLAMNTDNTKLNLLSIIGILVFLKGLGLEAAADAQKAKFSQKKSGLWIDEGVWRISRHPNYLGEIMVWSGMYLAVVASLSGSNKIWALASPIYIAVLLLFVSGIPLLEKSADKKWGNNKDYQEYKKKVPVLVPSLKSASRLWK